MPKEGAILRSWRLIPEVLRHHIVANWANENSFLRRLEGEFADATHFNLAPVKQDEILEVLNGEKGGYLITTQDKHKLINVHFSVPAIKQRQDLVEKKDGLGIYNLWGYLVFSESASQLFLPKGLRVMPLSVKTKGLEVHLIAFDMPLQSFSLQGYGFEIPEVFSNSVLFLYNRTNREEKFAVHFLSDNSPLDS